MVAINKYRAENTKIIVIVLDEIISFTIYKNKWNKYMKTTHSVCEIHVFRGW